MSYLFAFLELGGGCVFSNARNASSNLSGARVSRSVFLCLGFFLVLLCTYSLSAPAGLVSVMFHKQIKLAGQPVPSNTLPVGEALAFGLFNGDFHALAIRDFAVVPAEREFARVAVKVFAADMVERSHYATLEQAEKTFASVNVRNAAIRHFDRIFLNGVVHNVMSFELLVESNINASLICVNHRLFGNAFVQAGPEVALCNTGNNLRSQLPVTLRHGNERGFSDVHCLAVAFATNISLINFHRAFEQYSQRAFTHGEADAMRHEPCGLVGNIQHAVQLVCAHSLFGRTQEENRHQPFADRNVRVLKNRSHCDRELFPAGTAFVKTLASGACAVGISRNGVNLLGRSIVAAMRANRAVWPAEGFEQGAGFVVVRILGGQLNKVQVFRTERSLLNFHVLRLRETIGFVKYIIPLKSAVKKEPSGATAFLARDLAQKWPTCACGALCKALPRDKDGSPRDCELICLGNGFYHAVRNDYWFRALSTFLKIEARTAKLLKAGKKK